MRKMKKRQVMLIHSFLVSALLGFGSCEESEASRDPLPGDIAVTEKGLFPEGIAYDEESQTIYLSSIRKGKIVRMDFDGNIDDFVVADKLKSVLGLKIDAARNRLLVCNADPGFSEKTTGANPPVLASLLAYDLTTGAEIFDVDLTALTPAGSPHLANDVVLDDEGNGYVTSSLTPAVFKVTPAGEATLFFMDPLLAPVGESFGLNGIEWHTDGFLLLAHYSLGTLYKVPVEDPAAFSQVQIDGNINTIDGILLTDIDELVVVSNIFDPSTGQNTIHKISTEDGWASAGIDASIVAEADNVFPTTAALIEGEVMVVNSFLFELAVKGNADFEAFSIQKITF